MFEHVTSFHLQDGELTESPLNSELHNIGDKVCLILRGFSCERQSPWVKRAVENSMAHGLTPMSIIPPGHYGDDEKFLPCSYGDRIYTGVEGILPETEKLIKITHSSGTSKVLRFLDHEKLVKMAIYAGAFDREYAWNYSRPFRSLVSAYAKRYEIHGVSVEDILKSISEEETLEEKTKRWHQEIAGFEDKLEVFHNPYDSIIDIDGSKRVFQDLPIQQFGYGLTKKILLGRYRSEKRFRKSCYHKILPSDMDNLFQKLQAQGVVKTKVI